MRVSTNPKMVLLASSSAKASSQPWLHCSSSPRLSGWPEVVDPVMLTYKRHERDTEMESEMLNMDSRQLYSIRWILEFLRIASKFVKR